MEENLMARYLIAYEIQTPETADHHKLTAFVAKHGQRVMGPVWLIEVGMSSEQLFNLLGPLLRSPDRLVISEVDRHARSLNCPVDINPI